MTTDIEILVVGDSDVPLHFSDVAHQFLTGQNLAVGHSLGGIGAENLGFAARFQGVPIPRQARIKSAVVRLEAATSLIDRIVNARIDGLLVPNSETPTHEEWDGGVVLAVGHGRQTNLRTRAQVLWTAIAATTDGVDFDTPDISLIVQEIITHPEWAEGNALTLFLGDEDHESDQVDSHLRDALRSGVGPRLIVSFDVSADPARYEISLGALPQTLVRRTAKVLSKDTEAQVE